MRTERDKSVCSLELCFWNHHISNRKSHHSEPSAHWNLCCSLNPTTYIKQTSTLCPYALPQRSVVVTVMTGFHEATNGVKLTTVRVWGGMQILQIKPLLLLFLYYTEDLRPARLWNCSHITLWFSISFQTHAERRNNTLLPSLLPRFTEFKLAKLRPEESVLPKHTWTSMLRPHG